MSNVSPIVAQPIAQPKNDGAVAPWPSIDKTGTIVIGPGLSLTYVSSIFRLCLNGMRQQYVDLLAELLEKDPSTYSVVSKRVLGVAGGRLELTPAKAEAGSLEEKLAKQICDRCIEMLDNVDVEQHLASLAWATYYSMQGLENHWQRDGATWFPDRLSFIHSRRLAYPVPGSWDLYIWDQGQVTSNFAPRRTNDRMFGLRIADLPGKFIIHAPQIRGDYPTREGLGRQLAFWMTLKLVASRGGPQYLERFTNAVPEATYSTGPEASRKPATKEDIAAAKAALDAMGGGRLSAWVHADTIAFALRTPDGEGTSKLTFAEWISICNAEMSKAVLGGTLTTEVGSTGGNRALGETQKKSEMSLYKQDAKMLASTLKRDLIMWMVRLNFPNAPNRLIPTVTIHVEDAPDPLAIIEKATKGAAGGIPVDADRVAEQAGLPVIAPGDTKARRMFPILPQKDPAMFDADLAARAEELAPEVEEPDDTDDQGGEPDGGDEDAPPDDKNDDGGEPESED